MGLERRRGSDGASAGGFVCCRSASSRLVLTSSARKCRTAGPLALCTRSLVHDFLSDVLKNVISVDYTINGAHAIGDSTPLTWTDSLGMPPVANVVVIAGQSGPLAS